MTMGVHNDADHEEKAGHDKDLAERLFKDGSFPDWVIVSSFYFALHCVDAYAHRHKVRSFESGPDENISPHGKRIRFIKRNLKEFFSSYGRLFSRCHQCRYDPQYFKLVPPITVKKTLELAGKFSSIADKR